MKLSVRQMNSALSAVKREAPDMPWLIDDLKEAIKITLEAGVQEVEVSDSVKMKLIKELAESNEVFIINTQFGRR